MKIKPPKAVSLICAKSKHSLGCFGIVAVMIQNYLMPHKRSISELSSIHATKTKKLSTPIEEAQKILSDVPYEKGFHFFRNTGNYTGETAINLVNFYEELRTIEPESLRFHAQRGDFQNWIRNTLNDATLAEDLDKVDAKLPYEDLKRELSNVVLLRIQKLQKITKVMEAKQK
jgi:Family of unknown function (DUF5752)